jgi:uncharacterized protein YkwD
VIEAETVIVPEKSVEKAPAEENTAVKEVVPEVTTVSPTKTASPHSIVIEKLPLTATETDTLVSQIHTLTSLSRSQNNLPKLTLNSSLSTIAQKRSDEMVRKNYFSHTSPDGCDVSCLIKNAGYQTSAWGENLALRNSYRLHSMPELAQGFITDWLKSLTHRDNMLSSKYTTYGIGVAADTERLIVTVVFSAQ